MTEKLKPCPWCGDPPEFFSAKKYGGCEIVCRSQEHSAYCEGMTDDEAIARWNCRVADPPARATEKIKLQYDWHNDNDVCESCGIHFKMYGAAGTSPAFCPWCGIAFDPFENNS